MERGKTAGRERVVTAERKWKLTLRFLSVYLQVVINVLKGWMVLGFVCLGEQLYLINWVKGYCVMCSFMCRFSCVMECGAAGLGHHGVGMCVSGTETCLEN